MDSKLKTINRELGRQGMKEISKVNVNLAQKQVLIHRSDQTYIYTTTKPEKRNIENSSCCKRKTERVFLEESDYEDLSNDN